MNGNRSVSVWLNYVNTEHQSIGFGILTTSIRIYIYIKRGKLMIHLNGYSFQPKFGFENENILFFFAQNLEKN